MTSYLSRIGLPNRLPSEGNDESGQLSFDLDQDRFCAIEEASRRRATAVALLADLARALGEQRAEIDLAAFQQSLTEDPP
jgi:hypothetical protein